MKNAVAIFLMLALLFAASPASVPKAFKIDTNHSNIGFAVSIMNGLSKVRGKFSDFKMDLNFDEKDITKSTVEVTISAKSIDTGIDARDNHLRTADFFDVEKYPEITFKSKRIIKKGKNLTLVGDFTMHGVTKEISFPFKITGKSVNTEKKLINYGFSANLSLNRRDYNINWEHNSVPNFVGDMVEIELNLITRANKIE